MSELSPFPDVRWGGERSPLRPPAASCNAINAGSSAGSRKGGKPPSTGCIPNNVPAMSCFFGMVKAILPTGNRV